MQNHSLTELVPILQLAIGPVILISGVGMLLLTFTNRFGRVVDRTRGLVRELAAGPETAQAGLLRAQAEILTRRASILRLSITLAAVAALLAGVLILLLFLGVLLELRVGGAVVLVFAAAVVALIGSILAFIRDLNLALAALRIDLRLAPSGR
ncbi:MAG: DUF2721 domain-containing protein [Opitutaceae bacterium]